MLPKKRRRDCREGLRPLDEYAHELVQIFQRRREHLNQTLSNDAEELFPLLGEDAGLVRPTVLCFNEISGSQPRLVHDVLITQHDLFGLRHLLCGFSETVGKGVGVEIGLGHHHTDLLERFRFARPDAFQHGIGLFNRLVIKRGDVRRAFGSFHRHVGGTLSVEPHASVHSHISGGHTLGGEFAHAELLDGVLRPGVNL